MDIVDEYMKTRGLVSIVTPSWNCGKFLEETIKSIQPQTYTNWELLFQDDCSTDDTKEQVLRFAAEDARIKYECNPQNSGAATTRNNALRRAQGKWNAHPEYSVFYAGYKHGEILPKPKNLQLMIDVAEKLSEDFPCVRVDLYNVNGKIYFGELTFTSYGGLMDFYTDEFQEMAGSMIDLSGVKEK